nr:Myc-Jun-TAT fusion protein [synthetic construct]
MEQKLISEEDLKGGGLEIRAAFLRRRNTALRTRVAELRQRVQRARNRVSQYRTRYGPLAAMCYGRKKRRQRRR